MLFPITITSIHLRVCVIQSRFYRVTMFFIIKTFIFFHFRHLNPDIQQISNIAKEMSEVVVKIDQWTTQGDTVTLPSTNSPEINAFIKNIEKVYNFIIQLKNDL